MIRATGSRQALKIPNVMIQMMQPETGPFFAIFMVSPLHDQNQWKTCIVYSHIVSQRSIMETK